MTVVAGQLDRILVFDVEVLFAVVITSTIVGRHFTGCWSMVVGIRVTDGGLRTSESQSPFHFSPKVFIGVNVRVLWSTLKFSYSNLCTWCTGSLPCWKRFGPFRSSEGKFLMLLCTKTLYTILFLGKNHI